MVDYPLFMGGSGEPGNDAVLAIKAVTSAFEHALTVIGALEDPASSFHKATELWFELRKATDVNGQLRAVQAAHVANTHPELTLDAIAALLSTPGHRVKKARAGELIQTGREILERHAA